MLRNPILDASPAGDVYPFYRNSLAAKAPLVVVLTTVATGHGDPTFVPTRLLDIGGPAICLVLTNPSDRSQYIKYCCLSHCWGGVTDIPLLKNDTLNSFLSGIDITTLPWTFQDAILVTRQLHIRYL